MALLAALALACGGAEPLDGAGPDPWQGSDGAAGSLEIAYAVPSAITAVAWSVAEGAAGGSVTSSGLYTAPSTEGTYHVLVASAADPARASTATVNVKASPAPTASVNPVDYGAVGDGVADDTAAFQAAADTRKPLRVVAPKVRYRLTTGVKIYNSVEGDGSMPTLRLENPSGDWGDSMLQVVNYTGAGLTISGLHLDGGWTGSSSGEHSSGVHVAGSQNVTIEGMLLENFLGDGIYVGGGGFTRNQSRTVVIRNNDIRNPRRCTVAIIHVDGLQVTQNKLSKSNNFVANIDIEPNPNGIDIATNVTVDGNTFTAPNDNAISLYHSTSWPTPPGGLVGKNIRISNNTGAVQAGVVISDPSVWSNVTQSNNTFTR